MMVSTVLMMIMVMVVVLVGDRKHPCFLTLPQLQAKWLDRAKPYLPTFGLHRRGW